MGRLLLTAFSWTMGLGFLQLGVPLYGHHLGLSAFHIGILVAVPFLVHTLMRFVGGMFIDRVGEKWTLAGAHALAALSGPLYYLAGDFFSLLAAQTLHMISRAGYWSGVHTYGSRLVTDRHRNLARLNAVNNGGQIAGWAMGGVLIAHLGFGALFAGVALLCTLALAVTITLPDLSAAARREAGGGRPGGVPASLLSPYVQYLRQPAMYFAVVCSFLAGTPVAMSQSVYPLYLVATGSNPEVTGFVSSLRAIGAVVTGLLLASLLRPAWRLRVCLLVVIGYALVLAATPAFVAPAALGMLLFALGIGSALMDVTAQLVSSEVSGEGSRGSAMAVSGLGWPVAHMVWPPLLGGLADRYGLGAAFYFGSFLLLLLLPLAVFLYRRAVASASWRPADGAVQEEA